MLQGRRICVTGGAGFIGSHLVERLAAKNELVVLDNYHRDALTASGYAGHANVRVAKLATEHLAMNYHKQYGMATCSIRPFNIYGPRQVGEGAVHHFIARALRGEPLTIHNDGAQIRAWCYVDDIVDAILLCLERDEAVGHAFNIGNPRPTVTIFNRARELVRHS